MTALIGRPSRWSGHVLLTSDPDIRGAKPFRCDIILNEALASQDVRWRTLVHELLHTYSVGYQAQDYQALRGWEEGVIESLQRLLRPMVLTKLGVAVDEEVFSAVEIGHDYKEYVAALERLREQLSLSPLPFFLDLLSQPLRDRPQFVLKLGMALPPEQRRSFLNVFSASNAVLKQGILSHEANQE